jgi:hypothetical protein
MVVNLLTIINYNLLIIILCMLRFEENLGVEIYLSIGLIIKSSLFKK